MNEPDCQEFASDNTAGICPESWAALESANTGAVAAYGEDRWTLQVCEQVREIFEVDCDVYFVFNGTAANALALAQLGRSFHSVICHRLSHMQTDECGAPEFFTGGGKLLLVDGDHGKISLEEADRTLAEQRERGLHAHKPRVISITQATELGTVYSRDEIAAVGDFARSQELRVHMDGARFANAIAHLKCRPKEITWEAGVDVLCFGGTKNGVGAGELVVFFRKTLAGEFEYRVKQAGQLGSKLRFLAAGWHGLLTTGAWLRNAEHANAAAQTLAERLRKQTKLSAEFPVQSNAVFLRLSDVAAASLRARGWGFYKFIEPDVYRFMCSWATSQAVIERLVDDVNAAVHQS
jgi:threonine aldolase